MKLKEVTIFKYKSIEKQQCFEVDSQVTILVGMNESGKTSILEALAKTNYFQDDASFRYNTTHDFPRKEKKTLDKSGDNPVAVSCKYELPKKLLDAITSDIGKNLFNEKEIIHSKYYDNTEGFNIDIPIDQFLKQKSKEFAEHFADDDLKQVFIEIQNQENFKVFIGKVTNPEIFKPLSKYFENTWHFDNPLSEYVARVYLKPSLPKYLYYDEYYLLPSRISIEKLQNKQLESSQLKTAKALFELADIDMSKLLNSNNFEDFKAELEATEANISEELFKYWKTNRNLNIEFDIDKIEQTDPNHHRRIVEHILDIRVKNSRSRVSLPLVNRSKGFNWFFSFLVWFKKIQEDKNNNYILLLDEPGLNLHAMAQEDLLNFLEDLSVNYQIIYTTHSPFMIDSNGMQRVRTVVEKEDGTHISETIQEKDPNTLFPLQAALGYNIAQNLFISKNNLVVEGVSDMIYLNAISEYLINKKKEGLREDITIVPVGGLDKVTAFISLFRASKLNLVCLLDTFKDQKAKSRLKDLIDNKIIIEKQIKFFNDYTDFDYSDIEDLFEKEDYVKLYNDAFGEKVDINKLDISKPIIEQLTKLSGKEHFNHYKPANQLLKSINGSIPLSNSTLERFEKLYKDVNKLFKD